ncbi:MAG: prepilin-type N-terminal cleavage/methylation domain-containing protein [Actinobacteria bacterium]|nr:prepilin-type N-terminal cleavage/methylation domain-containing protein [Actinomycetota bacterium]
MIRVKAALQRRLGPDTDRGLSLVELIVVMMVTGIVLAIVGSMFVNVALVTANSNQTTTRSSIAANVMNEFSKVIRTASNNAIAGSDDPDPALVAATATSLTVYSYVDTSPTNPAPTKVTFRVDSSGMVFEDRVASSVSNGFYVFTGATTTRPLGGPIVSTNLFTYLDASNTAITIPTGGLQLADRNEVASIKVTITIANTTTNGTAAGSNGNDPVSIVNTIGMPNLLLTGTDS